MVWSKIGPTAAGSGGNHESKKADDFAARVGGLVLEAGKTTNAGDSVCFCRLAVL